MMKPKPTTHLGVLLLDDVFDTGVSVLRDAVETANALSGGAPPFTLVELGVRRSVRTHHGRRAEVKLGSSVRRRPDVLFVPALASSCAEQLLQALKRKDVGEARELVRDWAGRNVGCAAACTGTFLLGDAGVLDGGKATTSWWLAPAFRARFPKVELDEGRMVVERGNVLTAGAALAHLDVALALIRRRSPTLARAVADHLVLDSRASQSPFIVPSFVARADPLVERFEAWIRRRLAESFTIADAAKALAITERTLERRVRKVVGKSPIGFIRDVRAERAAHLLRSTDATLDQIATEVGYQSATTVGQLLRAKLGAGARALRRP